MRCLLLLLISFVTLVSCNNAGNETDDESGPVTRAESGRKGPVWSGRSARGRSDFTMRSACDCVNGLATLDMEDSATVAEFVEANEAVCEPLMEGHCC